MLARKAVRAEALLKVLMWGEPGAQKTRTALTFPAPLVIDLERGSELYGDEFDFLVASPTPKLAGARLVRAVVDELIAGQYPDRKTLVIDPVTDYLDDLETGLTEDLKRKGLDIDNLKGMKKAQAYAHIKDGIRERLDTLLRLPVHLVLVARAKNVWGQTDAGMAPVDRTYDARDIVEYLVDIVLHLQKGVTRVKKARGMILPEVVEGLSYGTLQAALLRPTPGQAARPAQPAPTAQPAPPPPVSKPKDDIELLREDLAQAVARVQAEQAFASFEMRLGAWKDQKAAASLLEAGRTLTAKRCQELAPARGGDET